MTRDSILRIAPGWEFHVSERRIGMEEILRARADGALREAFGTGTAAVVSPVGALRYRG